MPNKKERRRASHAGFHFLNDYANCPRHFFIHYLLRIVPKTQGPPLLFGAAFHEAKATYYNTKSKSKALSKVKRELKDSKHLYESPEVYEKHLFKGPILLEAWIDAYGKNDLNNFEFVCVEKEFHVPITERFYMTVRPDAVVTDGKRAYILETKTSMFSVQVTKNAVWMGDQATSYIYAVKRRFPDLPLRGVIPDVAYWNKNSEKLENMKFDREGLVTRTKQDLREFEIQQAGLISEISQKVGAWRSGYDPIMLFPRNTSWCTSFSSLCEYAYICRNKHLTSKGRAPTGFIRDRLTKSSVEKKLEV